MSKCYGIKCLDCNKSSEHDSYSKLKVEMYLVGAKKYGKEFLNEIYAEGIDAEFMEKHFNHLLAVEDEYGEVYSSPPQINCEEIICPHCNRPIKVKEQPK